jgi:LSD1 subclass zinc finger protein
MRYGSFEIRTVCRGCGQSIPVNGPLRLLTCTACFEETAIAPDVLAGFLNDFEEEYEALMEGQGRGGTLISGSGTFKYAYWRLPPRCSSCKHPLPLPENPGVSSVTCAECSTIHYIYPVPDWLRELAPSSRLCITPEPLPGSEEKGSGALEDGSEKLVVMSCPKCAGAVSISADTERVMKCDFCDSEVYIPDAVWLRVHPVETTKEWFVSFEGRNILQLRAERRAIDAGEEKRELLFWMLRNAPGMAWWKLRPLLSILGALLLVTVAVSLIFTFPGKHSGDFLRNLSRAAPYTLTPAAVLVPVGFVLRIMFSAKIGKRRKCKRAMTALARKHDWKHESTEHMSTLGSIRAKYRGRDIEIDPGEEYAVTVEIDGSPFYLKTEPPGYPQEGVRRFTAGDGHFDSLFPIRYAAPKIADRIERSPEDAAQVLAPVYWFLGRWGGRLGRLIIDGSETGAHLKPGHVEILDSGNRFLPVDDIEPLLDDLIILAGGIDAVASGRDPELPD